MLIVAGEVRIDEGVLEQARGALVEIQRQTRKESGCITYTFSTDIADPTVIRIFEQWDSMDALRAHFETAHMAEFSRAVASIKPRSMEVKVYDVAGELPLPS